MPSTFSPALRLELIGNGEQAANWGNTTNTNLGTLLEQAITGVGNITMADANYTLVNGNGISDEARNAVLVISSTTLTATRSVIVPTSKKFYAVRNDTTGGQSILVKTTAGTGVTLANGFTQLMYCDGADVVLASLPINAITGAVVLSSATLNNPVINGFTGDTAVINVGSGQFYKNVSGLVGIGISSPVSKLHVYAASGLNEARVTSGSNNTALGVDGSNAYLSTYQAIPILFQTNSVERMRIASSGAVSVTGAVSIGGSLAVTGDITSNGASVLPPGVIWEYGGPTAPTGWLLCDGSAVSRSTYLALWNILLTTYGAGNGTTTFNLPDRRGKFGVGADGTYTRGVSGGSTTTSSAGSHNHTGLTSSTTLTTAQIPAHSHTITDPGHVHSANIGLTYDGTFTSPYGTGPYVTTSANTASAVTGITINNAGGGTGHNHAISTDGTHNHTVTPPYVASNYIIKT